MPPPVAAKPAAPASPTPQPPPAPADVAPASTEAADDRSAEPTKRRAKSLTDGWGGDE
jgi:hypothetical protein